MGSLLSLLLCDIYMHYFEEEFFRVYKFPHWFKYVDDASVPFPSNMESSRTISFVDKINPCIQFTFEVENNDSLSFLGMSVSKHKN